MTPATAPCRAPPSVVKSFWYSTSTTAVFDGSMCSSELTGTGCRGSRPRKACHSVRPLAAGVKLLIRPQRVASSSSSMTCWYSARWPGSSRARRSGCRRRTRRTAPPPPRRPRRGGPGGQLRVQQARSPAKPQQPQAGGTTTSSANARRPRASRDRTRPHEVQVGCSTSEPIRRETVSRGSSRRRRSRPHRDHGRRPARGAPVAQRYHQAVGARRGIAHHVAPPGVPGRAPRHLLRHHAGARDHSLGRHGVPQHSLATPAGGSPDPRPLAQGPERRGRPRIGAEDATHAGGEVHDRDGRPRAGARRRRPGRPRPSPAREVRRPLRHHVGRREARAARVIAGGTAGGSAAAASIARPAPRDTRPQCRAAVRDTARAARLPLPPQPLHQVGGVDVDRAGRWHMPSAAQVSTTSYAAAASSSARGRGRRRPARGGRLPAQHDPLARRGVRSRLGQTGSQ